MHLLLILVSPLTVERRDRVFPIHPYDLDAVYRGPLSSFTRWLEFENVALLPHLGSATVETRVAMGMRALDNLDAYFRGERPRDQVAP